MAASAAGYKPDLVGGSCYMMPHRSEEHSRVEDWLTHLPAGGVRAMCSWERFCAFAREPERRTVAGDATVSVEGVSYEVEPELQGRP